MSIVPVLVALSIVVVPVGTAGIRISQLSGMRPGTLYPGVHLVTPRVDKNREFRRGGTSKAASQEHRPITLRVARTASLEEQP